MKLKNKDITSGREEIYREIAKEFNDKLENAYLTQEERAVAEVLRFNSDGVGIKDIARAANLSSGAVKRILSKLTELNFAEKVYSRRDGSVFYMLELYMKDF